MDLGLRPARRPLDAGGAVSRADAALAFAAIQLDVGVEETPAERRARVAGLVRAEAEAGADVVLLPEMWPRGWFDFDRYAEAAEPIDGPTGAFLSGLAREAGVTVVGGSFVEEGAKGRLHNTAPVHGPDGRLLARYRKIHLFSHEDAREAEVVHPGAEVVTFPLGPATAGLSICYDLRFPELYRAQIDAGAEVLLVVSAWPRPRVEAWRTLVRARAIESQAAIVACNAVGAQGGHAYAGRSAAWDPWGEPLGELGEEPGVLRVTIDPAAVREARAAFPPLRDRRLDRPGDRP